MTQSWLTIQADTDFSMANIPFGVFERAHKHGPRLATRIGDYVIDLYLLAEAGLLKQTGIEHPSIFEQNSLNAFIGLGKTITKLVRTTLIELFSEGNNTLKNNHVLREEAIHDAGIVTMLLPVEIGDYTDFYSSIEHATNVGKMFRDPENALLPNWKHLPVGYHGRASSIIVSGTPIKRPKGQMKADDAQVPSFGPTRLLDFELETGFIIGKETQLGETINVQQAEDHIFGMVLFNDWSARDIQKWEYVPLGPFLGKNFASSMSPWVVTMEALQPFRVEGPKQDEPILPYLRQATKPNIDIQLEVAIAADKQQPLTITRSNFKYMYWSMAQQLAHHTVNGCNIRIGDLMASGTISGPTPGSYGSMLEISWKGTKPITLPNGTERKFVADNDTVIMRGWAEKDGVRVGFGELTTKVEPASEG